MSNRYETKACPQAKEILRKEAEAPDSLDPGKDEDKYLSPEDLEKIEKARQARNTVTKQGIGEKVGDILDLLNFSKSNADSKIIELANTPYGYKRQHWTQIEYLFTGFHEKVVSLLDDKDLEACPDNNVMHVIGNGIQFLAALVNRRIRKNELDKEHFTEFKNKLDLITYYLDFLQKEAHRTGLIQELSTDNGILSAKRKFYQEKENPDQTTSPGAKEFPQEAHAKLAHFNFFTRLDGWQSQVSFLPQNLRTPIIEANFEEEFNKLPQNEKLNKERIRKEYFGSIAKAA